MKLRFKGNTLRLRLNQIEVSQLASGGTLRERVPFPTGEFEYQIRPDDSGTGASFEGPLIEVVAPQRQLDAWAKSDEIGIYFEVETGSEKLRVAVEKDLECVDGPPEEIDPNAFPRAAGQQRC